MVSCLLVSTHAGCQQPVFTPEQLHRKPASGFGDAVGKTISAVVILIYQDCLPSSSHNTTSLLYVLCHPWQQCFLTAAQLLMSLSELLASLF